MFAHCSRRWLAACAAAIPLSVLLAGCAGGPKIVNVWEDPSYDGPRFRNVLIVGIAKSDANARIFEDVFADRLAGAGIAATPAYRVLPRDVKAAKEEIESVVAAKGIDAIFVTRVIDVDRQTSYSSGYTTVYPGTAYYHDFYGFYNYSWGVYASPSYAYSYDVVRLETSVYETQDYDLVWTGMTETVDPKDVAKESVKLADLIMKELKTRGLL
jgi:hypothetical protein